MKDVVKVVGLDLKGAYLNLDGGFNSTHNRKCIFNAAIHALRMRVERTFVWEDTCKRLLLRFGRIQQRHYGMKVMAYMLINPRACCGA